MYLTYHSNKTDIMEIRLIIALLLLHLHTPHRLLVDLVTIALNLLQVREHPRVLMIQTIEIYKRG